MSAATATRSQLALQSYLDALLQEATFEDLEPPVETPPAPAPAPLKPVALALAACLGLAAACLWLRRELRRLQAALAQQAEEGAARERRLKELSKRIESYQQVNVRMGEALQDLGKQLAPLPDRVARLEQRDPTTLSFSQAARLVGLGASAEDLTQACGLSQAEAELVARLHEAKGK